VVDGAAVSVGDDVAEAAVEVSRRIVDDDSEILTLVAGADASAGERGTVEALLRRAFPELDVQVVVGDQPRYPFLIGVE